MVLRHHSIYKCIFVADWPNVCQANKVRIFGKLAKFRYFIRNRFRYPCILRFEEIFFLKTVVTLKITLCKSIGDQ